MRQVFEVISSGIVATEAVANGLMHSYGARGSQSIVVRDITSEIAKKLLAAETALTEVTRERDDLRRHLKALADVSDAVAAMTESHEVTP